MKVNLISSFILGALEGKVSAQLPSYDGSCSCSVNFSHCLIQGYKLCISTTFEINFFLAYIDAKRCEGKGGFENLQSLNPKECDFQAFSPILKQFSPFSLPPFFFIFAPAPNFFLNFFYNKQPCSDCNARSISLTLH